MGTYIYVDVSKKQEFIFKNNKLKDNLYNSLVIKGITEIEADKELNLNFLTTKLTDLLAKKKDQEGNPLWEHIFSGGGNSILKFYKENDAIAFIKDYSKEVLVKYPELELYISSFTPQNKEEEKFQYVRKELHRLADQQKDARRSRFRRISYGIEMIDETGKPKLYQKNNEEIESKNKAKENYDNKYNEKEYFEEAFKKKIGNYVVNQDLIKITYELDKYKKRKAKDVGDGNSSKGYIGIISIDGNKMGEIVDQITDFPILKEVGSEIEKLYSAAISKGLNKVIENSKQCLLITPIVFAGDDICIITEAEKSIKLAAEILNQIQVLSKEETFGEEYKNLKRLMEAAKIDQLTACGGVSIVKAGYPFFEAVALAEELCKNAKVHTYNLNKEEDQEKSNSVNASFLDWAVIKGGKRETLEYLDFVEDNDSRSIFNIKPLYVSGTEDKKLYSHQVFTYQGFKKVVENLLKELENEESGLSSSNLHKIKEAMYLGEARYKMQLDVHKIKLENIFGEENKVIEQGVLERDKDKIYVLRDIIEILEFWE